jgi:hypothetical protein
MSSVLKKTVESAEEQLCMDLLHAEDEAKVIEILDAHGYPLSNRSVWHPLGDNPGNYSLIGAQADDPTPALIEKIINSIDAVLIGECHAAGIAPDSSAAPQTMRAAVEQFLAIKDGRIGALDGPEVRDLANRIHLIATGTPKSPSYLVVDNGEGQTPDRFKDTFLSTTRQSTKIRIRFVQGQYNAGGTATLPYCGRENIQLIISRRQPHAPTEAGDASGALWGFTVIRRHRPETVDDKTSVFEYLAPKKGQVMRFSAPSISVLPGKSGSNSPPQPYSAGLGYGTCVKLYNYRWRGKGTATLEARRELEKYLQLPCLPFRVTETRASYKANYYSTTVLGVWNSLNEGEGGKSLKNVETGFPAEGTINVPDIGILPYKLVVWREDLEPAHLTAGGYFLRNGQVHGDLPADFVSRTLGFDYIKEHLLVAVDCSQLNPNAREDFFMASRDRVRKDEAYATVRAALVKELKDHPGLKAVNSEWRERRRAKAADSKDEVQALINDLIKKDPALAALFGLGSTVISPAGPGAYKKFEGKEFPSFFRIEREPKDGLVKRCPLNKTVRVDFETDAENMYFSRPNDPGEVTVDPSFDLVEASRLWNGRFSVDFRVPWNAKVGDEFPIEVRVTDVTRTAPFVCKLKLIAREEVDDRKGPSGKPNPSRDPRSPLPKVGTPSLQPPNPIEVRRPDWAKNGFKHEYEALKVRRSEENGFDFYVNIDQASLVTEMSNKKQQPDLIKFWFKWGLTFAALAMIRDAHERHKHHHADHGAKTDQDEEDDGVDLERIGAACDGLARVIVPIIRNLHDGPGALAKL